MKGAMKLLRWYWIALGFIAPIGLAVAADTFVNYADPTGIWQRFKAIDNGDGTFSLSIGGTVTAGGYAQGSTTSGQTGQLSMGAVTTAAPTYTTAQTNPISLTTGGALRHDLSSIVGTVADVNAGNKSAGTQRVTIATDDSAHASWGQGATGAAAPTGATEQGCVAQSAESVVTNGQLGGIACDLAKKQIVLPYANPENFVSGAITAAMTGTTSTSLVAAPAAGLRNYITNITCSNSHATVGTDILIQDGSGGTTLYVIPTAPGFGGASVSFPTPLRQPTTATAIFVANVTTGSNTKCSASGYKGA